jgi:HlyD family secretion protein
MKPFFYVAFFLCYIVGCKQRQEKLQAVVEKITESVYASGSVKSIGQYQVFSTVSGLIQKILVKEGDLVKKGSQLIVLVNDASRLNAENARLAAEYADVNANRDKLNELKLN